MANLFKDGVTQFGQIFSSLSPAKKISLCFLAIITFSAFGVLILWSNKPEFRLLYTNLGESDAGAIVNYLAEQKISYKFTPGGTGVMVPSDKVYDIRLQLASKGLPRGGGVGFEIFDRTSFGATEFVQKLNYQRALQGELSRTIGQLTEVEQARVHVVLPEDSLFEDKKERARASVVLKLKPGLSLKKGQIQGISQLVASAVEGLEPARVTIVDDHGRLLSPGADTTLGQLTGTQLEIQSNLESALEKRVETTLERVLGPGKVIAMVSASFDFQKVEKTTETYDPDSAVVRNEQRTNEKSSGSSLAGFGVPGVESNVPGGEGAQKPAQSGQSFQRLNETVNYEISKITQRVVEPVGKVKRLSAAVLLDGSYKTVKNSDGQEQKEYVPRAEEEMKKYENIVKSAIGFNQERGDRLEVVSVPFHTPDLTEDKKLLKSAEETERYFTYGKYGLAAIAALFSFFFIMRPLLKWLTTSGTELEIDRYLPKTVGELEAEMAGSGDAYPQRRLGVREKVAELAAKKPELASQLIKGWLAEDSKQG